MKKVHLFLILLMLLTSCSEVAYISEAKLLNSVTEENDLFFNGQLTLSGKVLGTVEANYSPKEHLGVNLFGTVLDGYNHFGGGVGLYHTEKFGGEKFSGSNFHVDAYLNYSHIKSKGEVNTLFGTSGNYFYDFAFNNIGIQFGAHLKAGFFNVDLGYRPHILDLYRVDFDNDVNPTVLANARELAEKPLLLHELSGRMGFNIKEVGFQGTMTLPINNPSNLSSINFPSVSFGIFYNMNLKAKDNQEEKKQSIF